MSHARGAARGKSTGSWRGRGGRGMEMGRGKGNATQGRPRLTHFISLPIGHLEPLRESLSTFTSALLQSDTVSGLHESIIIPPRRLHFTLGVMSLDPPATGQRSLASALMLLQQLKPRIAEILDGHTLQVALNRMDIMKPERRDPDRAHVLWLGPALEGEDAQRLMSICDLVHSAFLQADLAIDERRPLKLHCTIVNTTHRRPRGARQPFSYHAILASPFFETVRTGSTVDLTQPVSVDFGSWEVNEIQICEMGSYGTEGEYVSCGGCSFR